jgi:hypothetical protein
MSDVMKMDELLAVHHQTAAHDPRAASVRVPRDPRSMRWAIIGLGTLFYGIPALGMVGYAFWVAAHLNK